MANSRNANNVPSNRRVSLFVDGRNTYAATRALERVLDFKTLLEWFRTRDQLIHAHYFTLISGGENDSIIKLLDFLNYNGWMIHTKVAKEFPTEGGGTRQVGNMNVEFAMAVRQAATYLDEVYLFTGNGEFASLVHEVKAMGRRVIVVSTLETDPAMVADELRRAADEFWELDKFPENVVKVDQRR